MDNVVHLEPGNTRRRRRKRSKTALVLGGGGFTGGVYEIGALRALDLLSVNTTVNQFDVYVGTSTGSFVAALAANGVSPEAMMRVVNAQGPAPFREVDLGTLLRPNLVEFAKSGVRLPLRAARLLRDLAPQLGSVSVMDLAVGLAEGLPSGVYTGAGLERYLRSVLEAPGRTDDFRELAPELYLVATDLDSCERVVLGAEPWDDVPISRAVHASSALPMVFSPVDVDGRDLLDGAIVSPTNVDVAVAAGAQLVVVVNPLVPFVADDASGLGPRRRVSEMGLSQIGFQTFKLMAHQRLHEMARQWEARYPGVDFVLIEPEPDDELMFQTSIMNFASRVQIARHGFESVTLKLAEDYEDFRTVAARHGIEISATRVRRVVRHFGAEGERVRAWRKILEQTTGALLRQSGGPDPAG